MNLRKGKDAEFETNFKRIHRRDDKLGVLCKKIEIVSPLLRKLNQGKVKKRERISKHAKISHIIVKRDFPFPLPSRNYESNDRRNYEAFDLPGIPWRTNFIVQVFKILVKSDRAHRAAIPSSAPILTESRVSIVHGLRLIKRPNPARSNPRPIIPPLLPFRNSVDKGRALIFPP